MGEAHRPFHFSGVHMLTLYSYPPLFGVADNNGYGLKVYAFLKLARPAVHARAHLRRLEGAARPTALHRRRWRDVGDSGTILDYLTGKYRLTIDAALTQAQRTQDLLITRMLDDLYWVMSYSRWKDERYWPAFRDALKREHPQLSDEGLMKAKEFNAQRYYYAGHRALRS